MSISFYIILSIRNNIMSYFGTELTVSSESTGNTDHTVHTEPQNNQFKNAVDERLAKISEAYLKIINHLIDLFFDRLRQNVNHINNFEFEENIKDFVDTLGICSKSFFAQGSKFINDILIDRLRSNGVPFDKFKIEFSGFTFKVSSNYNFEEHFNHLLRN